MINEKQGVLQQFSFDGKKNVRGWLLLSFEDKKYLVKEDSFLFRNKIPRKIYKIENLKHFSELSAVIEKQKQTLSTYVILSIPIAALIRNIIPSNWVFGNNNNPFNLLYGLASFLSLVMGTLIIFMIISKYRYYSVLKETKLKKCGNILINQSMNLKGKKSAQVKLGFFLIFILLVLPIFIFSFFVQFRLFTLVIALIWYFIFFNGNYGLDSTKAEFTIKFNENQERG